ncbi:MAG TPA: Ig-like domain-containing protein [Streptosporangiaceae bacterium]
MTITSTPKARITAVLAGVLSLGAIFTAGAAPSAAVTGGSCPVAYDQKIFVSIPLPANSNGQVLGQIGVDCSPAYSQIQVPGAGPSHGSISWSGASNSDYAYSPAQGYSGSDTIQYCQESVANPQQGCQGATGTLTFVVGHANDDTYYTPVNTALLVGCGGCAGDPLTNDLPRLYPLANVEGLPSHGTLTWQKGNWSPASFEYQPDPGFTGTDTFTYCLSFETGATGCPATYTTSSNGVSGIIDSASSNIATVTIKVGPVPHPTVKLLTPTAPFTLAGSATVSWSGSDFTGGPGLAGYQVRTESAAWNGGFGAWAPGPPLPPTMTTFHQALAVGYDYCFEVQATDLSALKSAWSKPLCTARPVDDKSLNASSGWTRGSSKQDYQGTYSSSTHLGAKLTLAGATADKVALVATQCPGCGTVGVYAGSTLLGKVNLAHATTVNQAVFVLPAFSLRTATFTIKVLSSNKKVLIDGLGISRS